jgi:hypothetical protein
VHDGTFRAHFQSRLDRKLPNKTVVIATMHRMIRVAYGVLRVGTPYDRARMQSKTA